MTRFSTRSRAALAKTVLQAFVRRSYRGQSISRLHPSDVRDAIADLIADLGHYADLRFRRRTAFIELVSRGVGMWSAERRCKGRAPEINHRVRIAIDDGDDP
jgi:hypothetical protein